MRPFAVLLLCALAACRFEPASERPPGAECDCADGHDVASAPSEAKTPSADTTTASPPPSDQTPPTANADTARVTPDEAGTSRPSRGDPSTVSGAGLAMPVAGIEPGDLIDTFEAARSEGRTHDAIDILAPRGTPVRAAVSGEVVRLFTSDKGGLTIYQLGSDRRTVYYYAHLDSYAPGLKAGQRVRRGQFLGGVGDTGNAAPGNTHLHFAIWRTADPADFWDGTPVNPYPLLGGR